MSSFETKTYSLFLESVSGSFLLYPHLRGFIETGSDSAAVMMTINSATQAHALDAQMAMGGKRSDDGRKGIYVYMRWTDNPGMGDSVTFTVWQKGAEKYGKVEALPEKPFDPENPSAGFEQGKTEAVN